eukprot:Clim_evm2s59 gene=Clim_evmTU2s59
MKTFTGFNSGLMILCLVVSQWAAEAMRTHCIWDRNGLAVIPDSVILGHRELVPVKAFLQLARKDDGIDREIGGSTRIAYRSSHSFKCCQPDLTGDEGEPVSDKYYMIETFGDGMLRLFYTHIGDVAPYCVYANGTSFNDTVALQKTVEDRNDMWKEDPCDLLESIWVATPAKLNGVDVFTLRLYGTDLYLGIPNDANPPPNDYFLDTVLVNEGDTGMFYTRFLAVSPGSANYPRQISEEHELVDVCWMNFWTPYQWTATNEEILDLYPDCANGYNWTTWEYVEFPDVESFMDREANYCISASQ